jgi:hypothetical protein
LVLAGGDSISGEGEGGYVFDYVVLGLLLSGSEMVLDTLLLHAGSLSLQHCVGFRDLVLDFGETHSAIGVRCSSLWRVSDV